MVENDWTAGESVLRNLILTTGLKATAIQRLRFIDGDILDWKDRGAQYKECTYNRHRLTLTENQADPASTNTDGSFSRLFKAQLKRSAVNQMQEVIRSRKSPNISVVPLMIYLITVLSV